MQGFQGPAGGVLFLSYLFFCMTFSGAGIWLVRSSSTRLRPAGSGCHAVVFYAGARKKIYPGPNRANAGLQPPRPRSSRSVGSRCRKERKRTREKRKGGIQKIHHPESHSRNRPEGLRLKLHSNAIVLIRKSTQLEELRPTTKRSAKKDAVRASYGLRKFGSEFILYRKSSIVP